MLKSGSEFREFSVLTVQFPESIGAGSSMELATNTAASEGRPVIDVKHCKVTQEDTPDEAVTAIVERYLSKVRTLQWVSVLADKPSFPFPWAN